MQHPVLTHDVWTDHAECKGWLWLSSQGRVALCLDGEDEDYHMAASLDAGTQEVLEALAVAESVGLSLLDQEYEEPMFTPSGAIQHYLTSARWVSELELQLDRRMDA